MSEGAEAEFAIAKGVTVERKGNITKISGKPEGNYTLLFGKHGVPEATSLLPSNFDGLFIETGLSDYTKNPLETFWHFRQPTYGDQKQFELLLKVLEARSLPLYFADWYAGEGWVTMAELAALAAQTSIGLVLLGKFAATKGDKLTRRNLLKAGMGIGLTSFAALGLLRGVSVDKGVAVEQSGVLPKIAAKVNPQSLLFTLTTRNVIFAHKEEWLMRQKGGSPHMVTAIGAMHTGLETEIIRSPSERLEFLRALRPVLRKIPSGSFYKIVELRDYKGAWRASNTFEVPDLKEIIE